MAPIIRCVTCPVPIAGQSIEKVFRVTTSRDTGSWNLFNVEASIVVGPCVNFELDLMYNAFKMARMSKEIIVEVLRMRERCCRR